MAQHTTEIEHTRGTKAVGVGEKRSPLQELFAASGAVHELCNEIDAFHAQMVGEPMSKDGDQSEPDEKVCIADEIHRTARRMSMKLHEARRLVAEVGERFQR